jgi:hypothetical protein
MQACANDGAILTEDTAYGLHFDVRCASSPPEPHHRRRGLVSPQRTARSWPRQVEQAPAEQRPAYVSNCYLCRRNARRRGRQLPRHGNFCFRERLRGVVRRHRLPGMQDAVDGGPAL